MKVIIILSVIMVISITMMSALTLSQLQSTNTLIISKCDGSGFHKVTTDYGTEEISCSDFDKLYAEFVSESGTDMHLSSATWIEMPVGSGRWAMQVICVGSGTGCNDAKAQAFKETANPIFH